VVSVTPSSGSGSSQSFTFLYSDANGNTDIAWAQALVHNVISGTGGCLVHHNRGTNQVHLLNDGATGWVGPGTLGGAGQLENSQCIINLSASSVAGSGNNLTLTLSITFQAAFAGAKTVYMNVQDNGGQTTNWQARGTWTVTTGGGGGGGGGPAAPQVVSVTPSSGSGSSQSFTFLYSDANGASTLDWAQVLVHNIISATGACLVHHNRGTNQVHLLNDGATAWVGPGTLGGAGQLENSQCIVSLAASSVSEAGSNLTLTLSLTFKAAFAGARTVYMNVQDSGGLTSNWQARGTWTVP
jgi:hypothetical protein